ncbi:MAG: HlyD family secretion protein, partial [Chloroflexi bacterium]|nr:HlyD family secretion protein [Chloroflexota bacterium]
MKHSRTLAFVLLLTLGLTACNPFAQSGETSQQIVKVTRGDLTVFASGSGNLEISRDAKLPFGVGGRVDKIFAKENENVVKGTVLARLDDRPLKLALAQAQVGLAQAKVSLVQTQVSLAQAQVNQRTAEHSLAKAQETFTWPDIEIARADVDEAKAFLQYALDNLNQARTPGETQTWQLAVTRAQVTLASAEARLKAQVVGADTEEIAIKRMQVDLAKQSVDLAKQSTDLAKQSVDLAQQTLDQAQRQLDSAIIAAPFEGVVTKVSVNEGDTVTSLTNIMTMIDLSSLELKAAVDEIDIPRVKPGQKVAISVDAFPDTPLEGEVTAIAPLSTVQAGVVSYNVTVKFKNPPGSGLKIGMSATADIIIDKRENILLIPNRAVQESRAGKNIVR